ncbi:uncharacterized protein LOC129728839 [Wyeomyia smithii]|uniref:uncharacterized protein LOC129728839 n=1 Tax=Wyeomyia smithii TaxID=174621 RepID=UPI002467E920|nr:uncharacterized protein LOC129728839 [Wyeomyia smithii]
MDTSLRLLVLLVTTKFVVMAWIKFPIGAMYERIELIDGADFLDIRHIRVRKFNRTVAVLDGTFDLLRQLDDRYEVYVRAAYSTLGNNQFVQYPMRLASQKICEFFRTTWAAYESYYEACCDFPAPDECPIVPQTFHVKNHVLDSAMLPPYVPRGLWRLSIFMKNTGNGDILLHINVYGKIEATGIF